MDIVFKFILWFVGTFVFLFLFSFLEPNPIIFWIIVSLIMAFVANRYEGKI